MPYIPPELIIKAKELDLLSFLQAHDPGELVRFSGNTYTTKTHDSLKISNGKWMWWSKGIGGKSALDYLIKVKGLSFLDAVETILGNNITTVPPIANIQETEPKKLLLPQRADNNKRVVDYLYNRGIDLEIICHCIDKGLLYESLPYHNLVLLGLDEQKIPRYAFYRSINKNRLLGEATGSNKQYSFRLVTDSSADLHVFESGIDLLSFATLVKRSGRDWHCLNLLSLAGVYSPKNDEKLRLPVALSHFLKQKRDIKEIHLHLDNDNTGRSATLALIKLLETDFTIINSPAPYGKDFNDYLRSEMKLSHYER
ncbi:DUF3991 and toprim domain-containing protein [Ohessyouella blattaphilus]|uniref:DUF3991 and toprim domain-containing protein n=1 Tax=Ohessyouella blattaphilus TaxID=2949333 RepID=A0ABT1EMH9_9FIRM|nr:DUF3991 and toprim domain-containing protein [Ohessyouella blattaphilus]MCP1110911.1 DUF3991 and toprim domain-containing protein [Ohessyouella blattaphilus]MCR8564305.1 DUF3991 and toprim domain-containing protein [Ohessyouella blattaphilus]